MTARGRERNLASETSDIGGFALALEAAVIT